MELIAKPPGIEGITPGKAYLGELLMPPGAGLQFVCYNDKNQWEAYSPNHFMPKEEMPNGQKEAKPSQRMQAEEKVPKRRSR